MTLRKQIIIAFIAVIIMTVVLSVSAGYLTVQWRLGVLLEEIGRTEAVELADRLGYWYSGTSGWRDLSVYLESVDPSYAGVNKRAGNEGGGDREGREEHSFSLIPRGEARSEDSAHLTRLVLLSPEKRLIYDSFHIFGPVIFFV